MEQRIDDVLILRYLSVKIATPAKGFDESRATEAGRTRTVVTHVVIFTWIEGVTAERIQALHQALDRLAADFAPAAVISHGSDLRIREGNGDYALVATFADEAGWAAYQADPRHKAFVRDMVTPIQASRLTIQF